MPAPSAPSDKFGTGKYVAVIVEGKPVFCVDGSVQRKSNLVKVTNSQSGGYQEMADGSKSASLTLKLVWSALDPPPAIVEGKGVIVIVDTLGYGKEQGFVPASAGTQKGRLLEIPARIASITDAWQSDGDYTWTIQAESSGAYVASDLSGDQTTVTSGTATVTDPSS